MIRDQNRMSALVRDQLTTDYHTFAHSTFK